MLQTKLLKCFGVLMALATTFVMASPTASSNAALPQSSVDTAELEKTIEELEEALVIVKRIEENKRMLAEDSAFAETEQLVPQYQSTDEITEQDKLIAQMAKRLNDSAGLSNQDGSVIISGLCLSHQDKLILKNFVEGIREQLEKITGLKFPSSAYRILVMGAVPKSRKEDTKTAHYKIDIVPDAMPHRDASTIRLIIHHPSAMDSHEFAENVIRGYLALYTHVLREEDYDGPSEEPPNWFIKGLGKQIDFSSQQEDINKTLYFWSRAYIPPLENLITADDTNIQRNDSIASSLVGFFLDCKDPQKRMRDLFTLLANGSEWTPKLFMEVIRPNISITELDQGFDLWLLNQRFKIYNVGSSSDILAKRIITHLMFTPGVGLVPESAGTKWVAQTPDKLAKFKDEPWAKKVAEKNQHFILVTTTGRNDEFRDAAAELVAFYQEIIEGEASEAELQEKYVAAEKKLFEAIAEGED